MFSNIIRKTAKPAARTFIRKASNATTKQPANSKRLLYSLGGFGLGAAATYSTMEQNNEHPPETPAFMSGLSYIRSKLSACKERSLSSDSSPDEHAKQTCFERNCLLVVRLLVRTERTSIRWGLKRCSLRTGVSFASQFSLFFSSFELFFFYC